MELIDALVETRRVIRVGSSVEFEGMKLEVTTRRPGSGEVLLTLDNYGIRSTLGYLSPAKLEALGILLIDLAVVLREEAALQ